MSTPPPALSTSSSDLPELRLKPREDRRIAGGHLWIFSNEVERLDGAPAPGDLVEVSDARGAFLGRAYYNPRSLIAARLLTRGRDEVDAALFARRLERALRLREAALPGERTVRVVHGEADFLPGMVVNRYGDHLAVQVLTLGMEARQDLVREALERVLAPRGVVRAADSPLRALEGLPLERGVWWGEVPERVEVELEGFRVEADLLHGQKTGLFLDQRLNRRLAEARAATAVEQALSAARGSLGAEIARLAELGAQDFGVRYDIALIHAALGEREPTLAALEAALEDHSQMIGFLNVDPGFDGLRDEPRFLAVVRRLGLD